MPRRRRERRRCTVPDCRNPHLAKGLCAKHWKQKRRLEGPRCTVPGCKRAVAVRERGLCAGHLENPKRTIRVLRAKGDRALAWAAKRAGCSRHAIGWTADLDLHPGSRAPVRGNGRSSSSSRHP